MYKFNWLIYLISSKNQNNKSIKNSNIVDNIAQQEHDNIICYTSTINIDDMVMKYGVDNLLVHLKLNV